MYACLFMLSSSNYSILSSTRTHNLKVVAGECLPPEPPSLILCKLVVYIHKTNIFKVNDKFKAKIQIQHYENTQSKMLINMTYLG